MKRIITNILLAFVLDTAIALLRNYVQIDIMHDSSVYSGTWLEFIANRKFHFFVVEPMIVLIFILLPYNLIITRTRVRYFSLPKKIATFLAIMASLLWIVGTFFGVWGLSIQTQFYYLVYCVLYSIIFASIIHYVCDVDRDVR
ncbi:MAG: hypothetical protein REI78_14585 [Pedobacter sp.]|nr:hypothetical protein [Pedobacter sp.]MDQ8054256.1 hypothetical protein [Pedobacter sp.]